MWLGSSAIIDVIVIHCWGIWFTVVHIALLNIVPFGLGGSLLVLLFPTLVSWYHCGLQLTSACRWPLLLLITVLAVGKLVFTLATRGV